MSKKVLMVLTSHAELGNTGEKTGFWVEEFAAPYYAFVDAGVEVTLASPAGGQPPIDPTSTLSDFQTDATKRYDADSAAQTLMANTKVLSEVNSSDFDAVFYPGGHGPLWDLVDNTDSISLIESFVKEQKPVAAVCHASAAFLNVKNADSVISVCECEHSPLWSNTLDDSLSLENFIPKNVKNMRSQDLPQYYRLNGAIYLTKVEQFLREGVLMSGNSVAYKMDIHSSVDIDTKLDFIIAETILRDKIHE